MVEKNPKDRTPEILADYFSKRMRDEITNEFRALRKNHDKQTYRIARDILKNKYAWLEEGMLKTDFK